MICHFNHVITFHFTSGRAWHHGPLDVMLREGPNVSFEVFKLNVMKPQESQFKGHSRNSMDELHGTTRSLDVQAKNLEPPKYGWNILQDKGEA